MGWTSYYVGKNIDRKNECMKYLDGFRRDFKCTHRAIKTVMKGTKFYALMKQVSDNTNWVLCLLTRVEDGEFFYKDIQCNPHELDVPRSILKSFTPSTDEDRQWLLQALAYVNEKKLHQNDLNIGNTLLMKARFPITWSDGHNIKKGEEFFVHVEVLNQYSSRKNKSFILYRMTDHGPESCNRRLRKETISRSDLIKIIK